MDECSNGQHNCHRMAQCSNTNGSFLCECNAGFVGNAITICELEFHTLSEMQPISNALSGSSFSQNVQYDDDDVIVLINHTYT